jgi:hypothetical protein
MKRVAGFLLLVAFLLAATEIMLYVLLSALDSGM